MAVNHYETALFLLWVSDAYRDPQVERRICPPDATVREPYHRWNRYPHPIEVELRTIPDATELIDRLAPDAMDEDEDAEMRPIPMVNVTPMIHSNEDDDLSSYMEVSQFAVPAPIVDDGFIHVLHRRSPLRSSNQSIRSSQTTMTNESASIALQQAVIEANRYALELDGKFDKLTKPDDFDWWHRQIRHRLMHEAWGGILDGGEPYSTTSSNQSLSNKLGQRLNQCITSTLGDAIGAIDAYHGRGLEMLQAIIDHFVPSKAVNLPTIFREWNDLHQEKDELAAVFSGCVSKLANRSKRAGQEYTEISQILTFVDGLHEGFADFSKDYFSGRLCLDDTGLQDTTALAKTLELTMYKKSPGRRVHSR